METIEQVEAKPLGIDQLAAVHTLLSGSVFAKECDILVTTALEALYDGPRSERSLLDYVNGVWPGTGVDLARLTPAMKVGRKAGLVVESVAGGETTWSLTAQAIAEVGSSHRWALDVFKTTASQVRHELAEAQRDVSDEEAELWTSVLQQCLLVGARGHLDPYNGWVTLQHRDALAPLPNHYDEAGVMEVIEDAAQSPADKPLLHSLVMNALNPMKPFAEDLVTCITVGYVLQGIVGQRGHRAARAVIGSLRGDLALLDTPVLLQLLGSTSQVRPMEQAIAAALREGMVVVALEHYLAELRGLIDSVDARYRRDIQQVLTQGLDVDNITALIQDDVVVLWLRAYEERKYTDWEEFKAAASTLGEHLKRLGVEVRAHNNGPADNVSTYLQALAADMPSRPEGRSKAALDRDADTMAMAHRYRERTKATRVFWPGAWVITRDRHMAPAYHRVCPEDEFQLTLTPASWAAIVSQCSSPVRAEDLAEAAGKLLNEEAFMSISGRYPVKLAFELAQALREEGVSGLDWQVAQMSMNEMLEGIPDFDDDGNSVAIRVANDVIRMRNERLEASLAEKAARLRSREDELRDAEERLRHLDRVRVEKLLRLRRRLQRSREALRKSADALVLWRRRTVVAAIAATLGLTLGVSVYRQLWPTAFISGAAAVVLVHQSWDWMTDRNAGWKGILVAVAAEFLALVTPFVRW